MTRPETADLVRDACCESHRPQCCDPEDCSPCCEKCPTCPTTVREQIRRTSTYGTAALDDQTYRQLAKELIWMDVRPGDAWNILRRAWMAARSRP